MPLPTKDEQDVLLADVETQEFVEADGKQVPRRNYVVLRWIAILEALVILVLVLAYAHDHRLSRHTDSPPHGQLTYCESQQTIHVL